MHVRFLFKHQIIVSEKMFYSQFVQHSIQIVNESKLTFSYATLLSSLFVLLRIIFGNSLRSFCLSLYKSVTMCEERRTSINWVIITIPEWIGMKRNESHPYYVL